MNKHSEIILAGFGGQGILFAGKILAYAGLANGKEVSWLPSYGPEMRGGTANCHVVISDNKIGSPIIVQPTVLFAMNKPSLDKFMSTVEAGGTIVIDSSLISDEVNRTDVTVVKIDATKIARDANIPKLANMIMLGAFIKNCSVMTMEELAVGVKKCVPASKPELFESNMKAVEMGF